MNVPPPNYLYSGDSWPLPPERYSAVRSVVGPGGGDVYDAGVPARGVAVSFASGVFLVANTSSCDPTTGIDIRILEGVKFSQLRIGWKETHFERPDPAEDGVFTYTEHEDDLTTSAMHFDWDQITTPPWSYKAAFRVWRVE